MDGSQVSDLNYPPLRSEYSTFVDNYISSTVRITRESTSRSGTGFFVAATRSDGHQIFLVTNKHVLGETRAEREAGGELLLDMIEAPDKDTIRPTVVELTYAPVVYREHPNRDVDVCAMALNLLFKGRQIYIRPIQSDVL